MVCNGLPDGLPMVCRWFAAGCRWIRWLPMFGKYWPICGSLAKIFAKHLLLQIGKSRVPTPTGFGSSSDGPYDKGQTPDCLEPNFKPKSAFALKLKQRLAQSQAFQGQKVWNKTSKNWWNPEESTYHVFFLFSHTSEMRLGSGIGNFQFAKPKFWPILAHFGLFLASFWPLFGQ